VNRYAWVVGIDSKVVRTTDGGKTWEIIETGAPRQHFFDISVDTAGGVFIVGNGIVLLSGDNGRTWEDSSAIDLPVKYGWLYGSDWCAEGFAAVGWQGAVYRFGATLASWKGPDQ